MNITRVIHRVPRHVYKRKRSFKEWVEFILFIHLAQCRKLCLFVRDVARAIIIRYHLYHQRKIRTKIHYTCTVYFLYFYLYTDYIGIALFMYVVNGSSDETTIGMNRAWLHTTPRLQLHWFREKCWTHSNFILTNLKIFCAYRFIRRNWTQHISNNRNLCEMANYQGQLYHA